MVASGPGFTGGRSCEQLVSLLDVPPTLLTAGGVTPPETMPGRALQPLAVGPPAEWRDEVFVQISESQIGRAIRTPRWTYSVKAPEHERTFHGQPPASEVYVEDHLYDNHADPAQLHNRVTDPSLVEVRGELRDRLLRRIQQAEGHAPEIRPHLEA
jgi:arylsulfatase A-like enzyme